MSEKKKHHENSGEIKDEAAEMPEMTDQVFAEIEALKRQIEETETKLSDTVDGWRRTQADFQNYRKRIERDRESDQVSMKGEIIKKVLPALDDLERALQNRPADDAWASGIELIARKLQNMLDLEGVKRIQAEGTEFDPKFHEAISHEHHEDFQSGHVIEVVQNGYMLGERVIRPALVRVAQ